MKLPHQSISPYLSCVIPHRYASLVGSSPPVHGEKPYSLLITIKLITIIVS